MRNPEPPVNHDLASNNKTCHEGPEWILPYWWGNMESNTRQGHTKTNPKLPLQKHAQWVPNQGALVENPELWKPSQLHPMPSNRDDGTHPIRVSRISPIQVIWEEVKKPWRIREITWPTITFGTILGCNLIKLHDKKGKNDQGRSRLFAILINKASHLIWKLQCERLLQRGDDPEWRHTVEKIRNRWLSAINNWLRMDCLQTDKVQYGKHAMKEKTVTQTWKGFLLDKGNLLKNWVRQAEVLVGSTPRCPRGRHR